jgi:hypothetical protein
MPRRARAGATRSFRWTPGGQRSLIAGVEINAYEPPRAEIGTSTREGSQKLYSPGQVASAAFLGSPIAGCLLLSANFRVLAKPRERAQAIVGGVVSSAALFAIAFALPKSTPNYLLPVVASGAMRAIATKTQGPAFDAHLAAGGRRQSNWKVAGLTLACLVGVMVIIVGLVFARILD